MKKLTLLLPAIVLTSAALSTAQSYTCHTPRDGDRLHPGLAARSVIVTVNDSERLLVLNPESLSFDGENDAWTYIDTDTISYVQFATKHRFTLRGDTLSYLGYENRATDFRLDSPAKVAIFPLKDGDTVIDSWSGQMLQYGAMILKHVKGVSTGDVQGGWTLTDGTDTIRNATRLRWTLDMAYADPDSVTSAMPDSVASYIISEMRVDPAALLSERLLTERSMWFVENARYPVLTDSRVARILLDGSGTPTDTIPLKELAMHYPAAFQYSDTGEDIAAQKPRDHTGANGYAPYGNEVTGNGSSLAVGEPEVSADRITLTLSSRTGTVSATLTLFSDSGMRLTEPTEVTIGTVPQPYSIPVPTAWSGVVLLRVDCGEESYTRKAII